MLTEEEVNLICNIVLRIKYKFITDAYDVACNSCNKYNMYVKVRRYSIVINVIAGNVVSTLTVILKVTSMYVHNTY